jgi:hypothetical protein
MKQLIVTALLLSVFVNAQTNYEKGMQKEFQLWQTNNPMKASNLFERIAGAESDNWLPPYYAAQINITSSFGERDKEKISQKLSKAQDFINDAKAISQNNPEIMVLQALLHTAWVAYDGATYGMTLSPKVVELYTRASEIDPNNPRVLYCKAEWDVGITRYFGQDTAPFCKEIERSIELFANFKPETPFHPNWGKERAAQVLATCKK